jgi:hypothetical protein
LLTQDASLKNKGLFSVEVSVWKRGLTCIFKKIYLFFMFWIVVDFKK